MRALRTKTGFHKSALSYPHLTSDNKASLRPLTEQHEWILVPSCDALGVVVIRLEGRKIEALALVSTMDGICNEASPPELSPSI